MKGISKGERLLILLTVILIILSGLLLTFASLGYFNIPPPSPPPSKIVLLIDNGSGYGFVDVHVFNWGKYIDNATVRVILLREGILKETEKINYTGSIPKDTGVDLTFDFSTHIKPYEYRVDVKFDEIGGDRAEHSNKKINW